MTGKDYLQVVRYKQNRKERIKESIGIVLLFGYVLVAYIVLS